MFHHRNCPLRKKWKQKINIQNVCKESLSKFPLHQLKNYCTKKGTNMQIQWLHAEQEGLYWNDLLVLANMAASGRQFGRPWSHGPGMKDQLAFVYFSSDRSTLHGLYYIRFAYIFGHRDGSTVRNSRYCTLSSMNSVKAW